MYLKSNIKSFIRCETLEWMERVWKSYGIIKMTDTIDGKIPRGRPRQRRINIIKADLEKFAPGSRLRGEST